MKPLVRIASLSVVVLLLLQLTLPFFYIKSKREGYYQEAKKRMKRDLAIKIPASELLADKNFHWEKNGKEFFFNGGLYDVARMVLENGEYVMYAVPDFAEKAFLSDCAKKDPTSDDGLFSFTPVHLFPPTERTEIVFSFTRNACSFVYRLQALTADQLPEHSPPEYLI